MQKYKRIILIYFVIIVISFGLLLSAYYVYDPLQVFHKAWGREVTFSKNMRQQAAGILNNYDHYDSVIIGTSMIENTSSNEANQKLGGKFINISLPGSSYFERAIVLRSLFRQHKIKKIFYSLDVDKYVYQRKEYPQYPLSQFDYLYDEGSWNDFRVYFNYKYLSCVFLLSKSEGCIGKKITLDRPNAWFENENNIVRFGGLDKWIATKENSQIIQSFKNISETAQHIKNEEKKSLDDVDITIRKAKAYIDENILNFVKAEPNTHFILFDPPYSRMKYAIWAQYDLHTFKVYKEILRYLAQKSDEYSNLEIYSFGKMKFIDDIATYKDLTHYHYSINSWMLSAISKKKGLLHVNSIDKFLRDITKKALGYDLLELDYNIKNSL